MAMKRKKTCTRCGKDVRVQSPDPPRKKKGSVKLKFLCRRCRNETKENL